jgi:hypothetical protein
MRCAACTAYVRETGVDRAKVLWDKVERWNGCKIPSCLEPEPSFTKKEKNRVDWVGLGNERRCPRCVMHFRKHNLEWLERDGLDKFGGCQNLHCLAPESDGLN